MSERVDTSAEAVAQLAGEYRGTMDEDVLHLWAADAVAGLRALAAENAALRADKRALALELIGRDAGIEIVETERDAATARAATLAEEVEKLRAALQKIAGISNQCTWHAHTRKLAHELQDIIRAALAPAATAPRDAAGGGA